MKVKNNYQECLTNLACSIRKYFNLDYRHNTIDYIDEILNKYHPKNVVTILCDGMGYNILKRTLNENDFLIKKLLKPITTVFPATTVAATTSIMTGLNPVETGMLGWNTYYKEIDKVITTYRDYEKSDPNRVPLDAAIKFRKKYMITKSIEEDINEKGEFVGYTVSPFCQTPYETIDEMYDTILKKCHEPGKKYIYAYDTEPDSTMHEFGSDSRKAKDLIKETNSRIEKLVEDLEDTIIFVIADHGHINVDNIYLDNYPDIVECLKRNTSLDSRAVNFIIKDNKKEEFASLFNKYFSKDFDLLTREEVFKIKLFGDGKENSIFRDAIGDYIAVAKTNKAILYDGDEPNVSAHAGYTDDEVYIPLIIINKC